MMMHSKHEGTAQNVEETKNMLQLLRMPVYRRKWCFIHYRLCVRDVTGGIASHRCYLLRDSFCGKQEAI